MFNFDLLFPCSPTLDFWNSSSFTTQMASDIRPCKCHPGCTKLLAERTRRKHRRDLRQMNAHAQAEPLPAQLVSLASNAHSLLHESGLDLMEDSISESTDIESSNFPEAPDALHEAEIEIDTHMTRGDSQGPNAQNAHSNRFATNQLSIDDHQYSREAIDDSATAFDEDRETDRESQSTSRSSRSSSPEDPLSFSQQSEHEEYPVDDSTDEILLPPSTEEAEATLTDWLGDHWRERIHDVCK